MKASGAYSHAVAEAKRTIDFARDTRKNIEQLKATWPPPDHIALIDDFKSVGDDLAAIANQLLELRRRPADVSKKHLAANQTLARPHFIVPHFIVELKW